jgi:hypothetical protein
MADVKSREAYGCCADACAERARFPINLAEATAA